MNTSAFLRLRLAATAGVLALVGCGGGGSSPPHVDVGTAERVGTASANSDVSQANFPDWASSLARLVASTAGSTLAGSTVATSNASPAAVPGAQRARALAVQATHRKQLLATVQVPEACAVSGSITVTANDANNNRVLDAGDSIVIDSSACVSAVGDPPINGRMTLVVNIAELDSGGNLAALDASGSVSDFSVAGVVTLNGNFRFKEAPSTSTYDLFRFSYENLTAATPTESVTYNFDLYGSTPLVPTAGEQVVFQGSITLNGATYRLSQPASDMFVTAPGADLLQSGSLAILDAAGDRLVLTAKPGRLVDVVFYSAAAPTTPVVSLVNQDWNTLAFGP